MVDLHFAGGKVKVRFVVSELAEAEGWQFSLELISVIASGRSWTSGLVTTYHWPSKGHFRGPIDENVIRKIVQWIRRHGITDQDFLDKVRKLLERCNHFQSKN